MRLFPGLFLLLFATPALGLEAMADGELRDVGGREGVSITFSGRINADKDGNPTLSASERRLGLQLNNRAGDWIVIKDYYALFRFNEIFLDAGEAPSAATAYQDLTRFTNQQGDSIIPDGVTVWEFRFPEPIEATLSLAGMSVEYDDTTTTPTTKGYNRDQNKSFIGLLMSNSAPNQPASLNIEGTVSMFGF